MVIKGDTRSLEYGVCAAEHRTSQTANPTLHIPRVGNLFFSIGFGV